MRKSLWLVIAALVAAIVVGWWWHGKSKGKPGSGAPPTAVAAGPGTGASAPGAGGAAAASAGLQGKVEQRGGGPVAGAAVMLLPRDGEPVTVAARGDGSFAFDGVAPGPATVVAAAPGFLAARAEVALAAGTPATVTLTLAPGGTAVRGTVTDAGSGPIAGATVRARLRRGFGVRDEPAGVAITDGDGHYTLALVPGSYRIAADHPEYVGASAPLELAALEARLDFALVPGGAIEGVVKDLGSGAPVVGATVIVERDRLGGWVEGRARVQARSGEGGAFRVTGLVPGTLSLRAEVDADGRTSGEPVLVPLGIAEQASGVELWVKAAPYLAGKVVDEQGAPVADATVMAMGKTELQSSTTDAAGAFRIIGLAPGTWQLGASSAHHQSGAMVPVTLVDRPVTDVVLTVKRGPSVIGRVEPATAAQVSLDQDVGAMVMWGPGGLAGSVSTTAGDDGRFELAPMEPGRATLIAKAADGRRGKVTVEVPAAGSVETVIALAEGGSLAGKVADQHGAPVVGAAVMVKNVTGNRRRTMLVNGVDQLADRAPTGADGSFLIRGLDAGSYELTVVDERGGKLRWAGAAAGKERTPTKVALAEREQKKGIALAVELDDGVIRGIVRNPDGSARADAWVTASILPEELLPMRADGPGDGDGDGEVSTQIVITEDDSGGGGGGGAPVLTGADGRFELRGLRRGVYELVAEADKGALRGKAERVATGGEAAITLAGLAEITGTVTSGGAPVVDFTVELSAGGFGPGGRRQQTFHDAGGKFRFARVDVGRYQVRVSGAGGTGTAEVVADAGKPAEVAIAITAVATVRGRVVDAAGQPVAMTPVLAMPVRGDGAHGTMTVEGSPQLTDADGRFAIEVEPGDQELLVLGRGSPRTGVKFTAVAGQPLDLGTVTLAASPAPPRPPPRP